MTVVHSKSTKTYISVAAIKNVEWAVIVRGVQVVHVVLHLDLHTVPLVVLATLELLVPILFAQTL